MEELRLSKEELVEFTRKNKLARMLFTQAGDDYIAARCLMLEGLFAGLVFGCQAIEKILKSILYIESGIKKCSLHNPFEIKEKIKKYKDYDLDRFDDFLNRLHIYYEDRYPDNENPSLMKCSWDLDKLDILWFELIKKLPIPDELKYSNPFFQYLFKEELEQSHLILRQNNALSKEISSMKERYLEVESYINNKKPF